MSSYPHVELDQDVEDIEYAIQAMRAAQKHMALPARRRLLEEAAVRLERVVSGRARVVVR